MPWIGIAVLATALAVIIYCVLYLFYGRPANRWLAVSNGATALLAGGTYAVFMYDRYILDILSAEQVRFYCMRPMILLLMGNLLANTLQMQWRTKQ